MSTAAHPPSTPQAPTNQTASATPSEYLGQPAVRLALPDGSHCIVMLHGAHVVSWQVPDWGEQLYLSPQARMAPGQAIRGGVPVIFPQFEQCGPDHSLPRHGLVRTRTWAVEGLQAGDGFAQATLRLSDDGTTRAIWPHAFALELTVCLTPERLDIELHAHNPGEQAWPFSAALHTYLAVGDVNLARLEGLLGCHYLDTVLGTQSTEQNPELRVSGEIDRIYTSVPRCLRLRDGARRLDIVSETFDDAVLWNPGPQKCAALAYMPDADWQHMLCVEAAQISVPPSLAPGEDWTARQSLVLIS